MAAADAHPMFSGVPAVLEYGEHIVDTYADAIADATERCAAQLGVLVEAAVDGDERWEALSGMVGAFEADGDLAIGALDKRVAPIVRDTEYGTGPIPPAPVLRTTLLNAVPMLERTFNKVIEDRY